MNSIGKMTKTYNPQSVESRIYEFWNKNGYFTPQIDKEKKPFTIIMPPPNVTGALHMGHALTTALEDLMIRWNRMLGRPTLYLPGTDHAGIATQVVVERMLAKENITRHDLGREKFIDTVWQWVDKYGETIYTQLERLGASCDWSRKAFTLDDNPAKAVRTTFVNLYRKGLIYRGERITNWCPRCLTALSDLEVKYVEENANLYYIRYNVENGYDSIIISTTRPETLLGDTAVAVNPRDERYEHFVGLQVILPILNRPIPIIADDAVEQDFGTGALKVTPGHDHTDFEIGQRNGLPTINILSKNGKMNDAGGPYSDQDRFDARKQIVIDLEAAGLLDKVESYHHSVGHCDRCNEVVEPMISNQWYVKMERLAAPAKAAVSDGRIKIIPNRFTKVYFNWLDNIRDWCISRQLWWGHQIPVWYCDDCKEITVDYDDPKSCSRCDSVNLNRDPDVLDTWFSSGLWTHSTLGWPETTEDLDYFYPTNVMETGYDILFFWVARMIFMGIENMGKIPFETIYLHGLVLDPEGIKMSKTKGNVLNPLDLVNLYGADALRFALTTGTAPGNNIRLNEQKIESSRNFANKIWNASRFVVSKLEESTTLDDWTNEPNVCHLHDRWIISRLNKITHQVCVLMEGYQFSEAQRVLHDFLWGEFADWYIEMAKIRLQRPDIGEDDPTSILAHVLEKILRLLHPFMPFITEEIWQTLRKYIPQPNDQPDAIIVAPYPEPNPDLQDDEAESEIGIIMEIVHAIRNVRAEFKIPPSVKLPVTVNISMVQGILTSESYTIMSMARVEDLAVSTGDAIPLDQDVTVVLSIGTMTIPIGNLVDLVQERERLLNEIGDIDTRIGKLTARLSDHKFLSKAPKEVVDRERIRLETIEDRRDKLRLTISRIQKK